MVSGANNKILGLQSLLIITRTSLLPNTRESKNLLILGCARFLKFFPNFSNLGRRRNVAVISRRWWPNTKVSLSWKNIIKRCLGSRPTGRSWTSSGVAGSLAINLLRCSILRSRRAGKSPFRLKRRSKWCQCVPTVVFGSKLFQFLLALQHRIFSRYYTGVTWVNYNILWEDLIWCGFRLSHRKAPFDHQIQFNTELSFINNRQKHKPAYPTNIWTINVTRSRTSVRSFKLLIPNFFDVLFDCPHIFGTRFHFKNTT